MRRSVAHCCVLIVVVALPAYGQQQVDVEAELRAALPYTRMLHDSPGLTLEQYNAAVRAVAAERVGVPTQLFMRAPQVSPIVPRVSRRITSPPFVVGAKGTYLGVLSNDRYDPNSVRNPYGQYGSPYGPTSMNNPYGFYGSPYSPYSATNPYATHVPMIVTPYLGWLSANPYAIAPLPPLAPLVPPAPVAPLPPFLPD